MLLGVIFFCRVLGQVSCELVAPKPNRATEGILFFNLELSPMASPAFELGRYVAFAAVTAGRIDIRMTMVSLFSLINNSQLKHVHIMSSTGSLNCW